MIPAQTTLVPAREGRAGPALDGLTLAEARERAAAGQVNAVPAGPGRSLGQILRANPCTRFNAILGTLFGVVLVVGPPQDALFGLVLAATRPSAWLQRFFFLQPVIAVLGLPGPGWPGSGSAPGPEVGSQPGPSPLIAGTARG
jgi:hypothetical protein